MLFAIGLHVRAANWVSPGLRRRSLMSPASCHELSPASTSHDEAAFISDYSRFIIDSPPCKAWR